MAVTNKYSEQFILELYRKEHDVENDSLVVVLLGSTFPGFDPATHSTYSDIGSYEIPAGNGYTQKTKTLSGVTASISSGKILLECSPDYVSWTATDSGMPAVIAAAIINDTHPNDTIVCCIEFDAAYVTDAGLEFQISFANGITDANVNPGTA